MLTCLRQSQQLDGVLARLPLQKERKKKKRSGCDCTGRRWRSGWAGGFHHTARWKVFSAPGQEWERVKRRWRLNRRRLVGLKTAFFPLFFLFFFIQRKKWIKKCWWSVVVLMNNALTSISKPITPLACLFECSPKPLASQWCKISIIVRYIWLCWPKPTKKTNFIPLKKSESLMFLFNYFYFWFISISYCSFHWTVCT